MTRALALLFCLLLWGCGDPVGRKAPDLGRARAATVALELVGQDAKGVWQSHGAGTLLHEAGYVLTCEHITAQAAQQSVVLSDGRRFPFRVMWRAGHHYDLALLVFDAPSGLKAIELGRSASVSDGDRVVLIGNPGGAGLRSLAGIVDRASCGGGTQLQVREAEVVPGDSGGPVLDQQGRQIGHIHVAIRGQPGISRHIRMDQVRAAAAGWLAQAEGPVKVLGLTVDCAEPRALVTDVRPDSAAARAGLAVGDVIRRAGDLEVREGIHWAIAWYRQPRGVPIALRVERGAVSRIVTLAGR